MAIAVKVNICIDGGAPLADYHSVSIRQDLFTHHSFQVAVPYEILETQRNDGGFHRAQYCCGKSITIVFTPVVEAGDGNTALVFKGIITHIVLSNSSDFAPSFVLSGFSPTYLLEDGTQRRTFWEKGLKEIFTAVLEPYSKNLLPCGPLNPQHQQVVEYTVQYGESSYNFLRRLADEYGEWFYYDGQALRLGLSSNQELLPFVVQGTQSFSLAIELKPTNFGVKYYDYLVDETYKSNSAQQTLSQLNPFTAFALGQSNKLFAEPMLLQGPPVDSQPKLDTTVRTWKEALTSSLVTFQGTGENPGFGVGRVITVKGSQGHDYGRYRLTEITHSVQADEYHNTFTALPHMAKQPPPNPWVQAPKGVPELAEVIDVNDPNRLGRIRVRYYWPVAGRPMADTCWLRVSTPYSGDGKGQLFIPEKDSQVLVDYEEGQPNQPLVLGNLFHARNPQKAKYTYPNNEVKGIQTAGGNKIVFDDDKGSESIRISNGRSAANQQTELIISFTDSGAIVLKTSGDIELSADEKISLVSKEIQLKATAITIHGSNVVAVNGQQLELEAAANAKLTGGTAEVIGNTMTTIKGALVKIN